MTHIKNIGYFCKVDEEGNIRNESNWKCMNRNFQKAVERLVELLLKNVRKDIHSIYIRGSLPKGLGVEHVSDIDAIVLIDSDQEANYREIISPINQEILNLFPYVNGVEIGIYTLQNMVLNTDRFSIIPFMIKTHSLCVYGENIQSKLPSYPINEALANDHIIQALRLIKQNPISWEMRM
ncbi:hypothetical protein LCL89_03695 [Halobacillus yeomjeoni]|uniref:hypothetical protein n=1 Tax=Halobacillus yeomjeoni TaxID=311194 RepID=UPI001CD55137|nr:hypothetical protein [Halobacillus yeomjeoni]MCA0983149.1 hypothetical protein [Halobacillus yeomjeoni]